MVSCISRGGVVVIPKMRSRIALGSGGDGSLNGADGPHSGCGSDGPRIGKNRSGGTSINNDCGSGALVGHSNSSTGGVGGGGSGSPNGSDWNGNDCSGGCLVFSDIDACWVYEDTPRSL